MHPEILMTLARQDDPLGRTLRLVAEPSASVSIEKARRDLGWDPGIRSDGDANA